MFLPTFLSLSVLALLQLGATQGFLQLTRNQLREEIRAGFAAALSSENQSPTYSEIIPVPVMGSVLLCRKLWEDFSSRLAYQQQILLHAFWERSAPCIALVEALATPQSPAGR